MPPRKRNDAADKTNDVEESSGKKRNLSRESIGATVKPPSTWANATVQKIFQSIAAYSVAGSLFEKKTLGTKGQFELFSLGFHGSTTVDSKARHVVHGDGRFSRLFVQSSSGPKTVDPFYIYGGENCCSSSP